MKQKPALAAKGNRGLAEQIYQYINRWSWGGVLYEKDDIPAEI